MTSEPTSLQDAVSGAIERGRAELSLLDDVVDRLVAAFAKTVDESADNAGEQPPLIRELEDIVRGIPRELRKHLDRERDALGTFNIAFFGRTGVGKSTLLSAFGELDGSYVSPGASDWTTDVRHIEWRGCRLYDTPGINGWGRTESRDDLELRARRAVEIADIVLLCFDNQSQQAMEFAKIADWVRDYGKPVAVVLNVRNPRWRDTIKVPRRRRKNLSESVRQHADNIRTELANIGLPDTPVVAVHSRRALFARAATPFHGPGREDFLHERAEFGTETLTRWSNFETLERLITAAIVEGAADLRLNALREDVRARCKQSAEELSRLAGAIEKQADALDREIESLFAILGYPEGEKREKWLQPADVDLVAAAEATRGRPYTSPAKGSLDRYVRYLSGSHLAQCRRKARTAADELIENAFNDHRTIDEAEFTKAVFDESAIRTAIDTVWTDRQTFLEREIDMATGQQSVLDHSATARAAAIRGSDGSGAAGKFVQGGGIAVGLGALAVPVAIANFWNPAGWVAGVAVAGVGVAGQLQQRFGKRLSERSEEAARKARVEAIANSHRAVDQTFDDYEDLVVRGSREAAWVLASESAIELLTQTVLLRRAHGRVEKLVDALNVGANSIGASRAPKNVLLRAQEQVADTRTNLTRVLLGEDWLDSVDSSGQVLQVDPGTRVLYAERNESDKRRLCDAIIETWATPPIESIRAWRDEVEAEALRDSGLLEVTQSFSGVVRAKPVLSVFGDYNSGKSSLIRRILLENDVRAIESIDIRAVPATEAPDRYELPRFDLVDTPGLQGGDPGHAQHAVQSAVESALVFVVVHINLLVGDTELLEQLARGSSEHAAKGGRMVFLINRCDELGADPLTTPDTFLNLAQRKREELCAALARRSIDVGVDRIHVLSGDPYGLAGGDHELDKHDFDGNRAWDGVGALIEAIAELPEDVVSSAKVAAAFDTAVTALKRQMRDLHRQRDKANADIHRLEPLLGAVRAAHTDASIISDSLRERAHRIVQRLASDAESRVHGIDRKDNAKLKDLVESWWREPQVEMELERYLDEAAKTIDEWRGEHESAIGRESRSAQFEVMTGDGVGFQTADRDWLDDMAEGVGETAGNLAPLVKAFGSRDAVYQIGKQLGHKFKPWGAVKGGVKVARAGAVLAVVAAAADATAMANDARKANEHQNQLALAMEMIDKRAEELVAGIVDGDEEPGPVRFLVERMAELDALLDEHLQRTSVFQNLVGSASVRARRVEALLNSAEELTGTESRRA